MLHDQPPVTGDTRSRRCPRATHGGDVIARPTNPDAGPSRVGSCDGSMHNAGGSHERTPTAMGASVVQRTGRVEGMSHGHFLTDSPFVIVAERGSREAR
jgi:hypothetical protein